MGQLGDAGARFPAFLPAFALAFAAYWLLTFRGAMPFAAWMAAGLLARAALLPLAPSDDVHRYLFEAKVLLEGMNPYRLAPSSPELQSLRDADFAALNHPDFPALYPPLAQALFCILRLIHAAPLSLKLFACLCDCLSAVALRRRFPLAAALLFLNPLLALEGAGHGHYESLVVLAMTAVLLSAASARRASWTLAAAVWIKPHLTLLAAAVLPPRGPGSESLPARMREGARRLLPATAALGLYLALAGPSLLRFATHYQYNSLVPYLLRTALDGLLPFAVLRLLEGALFLAAILGLAWHFRRADPWLRALVLISVLLAFSPTVHPWYALWALPAAAVTGGRPWILLTGTSVLAYAVYFQAGTTGLWREISGLRWAIFLPPLLLGLWEWRRGRYSASSSRP